MAVLDLSKITTYLITLLTNHIQNSPAWPKDTHNHPIPIQVLPDPPDILTGDNTLGVYLYHIGEDPGNKNLPLTWERPDLIRNAPMPLLLYYQVCAHSDLASPIGTSREQLIMGCALKALHDYPVIGDATQVNGVDIIPANEKNHDNRMQIVLRPVTADEATHYWTTGSKPLRLAAYYQVSVVMLEAEAAPARASRVLVYNAYAFPSETPYLTSSSNVLTFRLPSEVESRQVNLRPAQVTFGGVVQFEGSGLGGDRLSLLLNHASWDKPLEVDSTAWGVQASPTQVRAVVQNSAAGQVLPPSQYSALVRVIRQRTIAGGRSRDFEYLSNETPFTISPTAKLTMGPAGEVTIDGCLYQGSGILPDGIRLYVGGNCLNVGDPAALNPGEYAIVSDVQIHLKLPDGLTPGEFVPFRLIVNGAESAPAWIQIP